MHRFTSLILLIATFFFGGCGDEGPLRRALPFPTPAQHDLVLLVSAGPLSYITDDNGNPGGLEYDLAQAFAQELGVGIKVVLAEAGQLEELIANNRYHIAASWLSARPDSGVFATPPIFQTRDMLVQHEATLPISSTAQLAGKTVHVMAGSRQANSVRNLTKEIPDLNIVEVADGDILDLLERLGNREVDFVVIDDSFEDIANQYVPTMRTTLPLSQTQSIVWLLGKHPNAELKARLDDFIERAQRDGTLARIEDRYLGHVRRLTQSDVVTFLGEIEAELPKFRKYFQAAQVLTGLDWRLIAAVAYHESHWDPNATSYTNVRGIMMLTEDTADRLQVSNRLNPGESILAGARYINMLKDQLPPEVSEPDRTWLALAAYNIGPGHFSAARTLAKQMKADPNAWYEMKRILPKLSNPKIAQQMKTGRARGGEAVILVENIRSYYDILQRNAPPFGPTPAAAESLKRLVAELENRRKSYVRKPAASKPETSDVNTVLSMPPRLPTITPDTPSPAIDK